MQQPATRSTSQAPQMSAVAQRHFQDAIAFYKAGNFDAARVEFSAAYDLSRLPDLLHNLSQVAEQQGRFAEAIALEERCMAEKGNETTLPERDEARGRIARLRERMAAAPAAPNSMTPAAVPNARSTSDAKTSSSLKALWPAVALVGVGAGLLLSGVGCGAGALATQGQVSAGGPFYAAEYDSLLSRGRALNGSAIGLGLVGGGMIIAGSGWWLGQKLRNR